MQISVQELVEIARLIKNEERINIDIVDRAITIKAKAGVEEKLLKPITLESPNTSPIKIDKLGVYKLGELRIWVVKE